MYKLIILMILSFSVQAHQTDVVWIKYAKSAQGIATLEGSDSGFPKLYLSMKNYYVCNPEKVYPTTQRILNVDGVNITFKETCYSSKINQYGISLLTPKGEVGTDYVVRHFSTSKQVIVDGVYFDARGFKSAYKNAVRLAKRSSK